VVAADGSAEAPRLRPPSLLLMLAEARSLFELNSSLMLSPVLLQAPKGDGHPVLTLPGFLASDLSMVPMRRYLTMLGYDTRAWNMGRNLGGVASKRGALRDLVKQIHEATGRKVSIIGWSLGGVFAREIASAVPDAVRTIITLGSPIQGDPRSTNAWRVYELASGQSVDDPKLRRRRQAAPPVPTTSIYSRTDGIVAWRCSVEQPSEHTESIEVPGSHCGLAVNPAVLYSIADRLAQPEGKWKHFDRSGLRGWVFPDPSRHD
jgi:pimeloyl-ACP methyl ester carboxylesterase